MRKNKAAYVLLFMLLTGCSIFKNNNSLKQRLTGKWNLETVTIEGNDAVLNDMLFDEAANKCFIGSNWEFATNGKGTFSIPESKDCKQTTRKIQWNFYEQEDSTKILSLKRYNGNNEPLDSTAAHQITVSNVTATTITLTRKVSYENNTVLIVYNFVRKQ